MAKDGILAGDQESFSFGLSFLHFVQGIVSTGAQGMVVQSRV